MQEFSEAYRFTAQVEQAYACMMRRFSSHVPQGAEPGLGGRLFYAGLLDEAGRTFVVAGNVAGAAILTVTADTEAQKAAIRDGVVDFLVTSLDEALRILKNEVRKGDAVAVCVGLEPEVVEREMASRGVVPDLTRDTVLGSIGASADRAVRVSWHVGVLPAKWLPQLDALALECQAAEAGVARRWLRLAPRYLGRMARSERLLVGDSAFAACFVKRLRYKVEQAEIAIPVMIRLCDANGCEEHIFAPASESLAG